MKVKIGNYRKKKSGQKVKVKIDRWDTWNVDVTISHVALPLLKAYKEEYHGAPFTDDEDVPEELRSTSAPPKENDYDTDDNHFKRWEWILGEMIFAFECTSGELRDWESQFYSGEVDFKFKKIEGSKNSEMVAGPNHTFTVDREGTKVFQERINNGFRLFGKYYQHLWS